jgi:hypothetical protein
MAKKYWVEQRWHELADLTRRPSDG